MTEETALEIANPELRQMIDQNAVAMKTALAGKLQWLEFASALSTAVTQDKNLAFALKKQPHAVLAQFMSCAALGLRPGKTFKHFSIIMYGSDVTDIVEWRGLAHLAEQSGTLEGSIKRNVIFEHEEKHFHIDEDTDEVKFYQRPLKRDFKLETEDKLVGVYATCKVRGRKGWETIVLDRKQVERRRSASASWKAYLKDKTKKGTPWLSHPEEMWLKSAIRALLESGKVPMDRNVMAKLEELDVSEAQVLDAQVVAEPEVEEVKPAEATVVDPTPEQVVETVAELDEATKDDDLVDTGKEIIEAPTPPDNTDAIWERIPDRMRFEWDPKGLTWRGVR